MIESIVITTVILCIALVSGVYHLSIGSIQSFRNSSLKELQEFRVSQENLLLKQREDAEEEVQRMVDERNEDLERRTLELEEAEAASVDKANKQIQEKLDTVQKEYHQMEQHFRQSVNDDVTLKLVMAAYTVVARGEKPRDLADSTLTNAVIEHKRAASDYTADDEELN